MVKISLIQEHLIQVTLVPTLLILALSYSNKPSCKQLGKHSEKVFINKNADVYVYQYTASKQKVVTFNNLSSNTQVLKPCFVNKIKDLYTDKVYEKY